MAHGEPNDEERLTSMPDADQSVTTQRRALAVLSVLAGVAVFAGLQALIGLSVAVLLAAIGTAGAVFAGGVLLACYAFGHAVECATGPFCECERCGRPMDDRQ